MCENQRGICLLPHLCKALTRLCANRMSQYFKKESILPDSQSASEKQKDQQYGFHNLSSSILLYGQKHPTVLGIRTRINYRYSKSLCLCPHTKSLQNSPHNWYSFKAICTSKTLYGENNCRVNSARNSQNLLYY